MKIFWEPGITDIQDSANIFVCELCDNDTLKRKYPDISENLPQKSTEISKYIYLTSKKEFFEVESQIETFGGFMVIKCCPKKKHKNEVRAVYELCVSGLSCIAKQYPRNAEVKFKGRGALSKVGG